MLTRAELDAQLHHLEAALPAILKGYPDETDLWPAFVAGCRASRASLSTQLAYEETSVLGRNLLSIAHIWREPLPATERT